jgi:hypothetical protein
MPLSNEFEGCHEKDDADYADEEADMQHLHPISLEFPE